MKIVALLTIRNESLYLARCLRHLYEQGVETCVIDNGSTDDSLSIAQSFLGRGVFRIDHQPYLGYFDLVGQLNYKERLAMEIDANWFIHIDADEIREAPPPYPTLREAIIHIDAHGYDAINFDEFVFLPTSDTDAFEGTDYVQTMRYYYFFEPKPLRQIKAWKNKQRPVELASSGGHNTQFDEQNLFPKNFVMRHYIALSRTHAIRKYTVERIYSQEEVKLRGWHGPRVHFTADKLQLPNKSTLKCIDSGHWDTSDPWPKHYFLGDI